MVRNRTAGRAGILTGLLSIAALCAACDVGKVEDEHGRKLTLVGPAAQKLARGETNRVVVAIARTGIDGPVGIRFEGLPAGVSVVEAQPEIAAEASTGTFTLHAANDAEVGPAKQATVTALGPGGMTVSERFEVAVVEAK
jgi:hypothetical protein